MGLVTRRNEQLEKLFDQFAVDPKKPKAKPSEKEQTKNAKDKQEKKD